MDGIKLKPSDVRKSQSVVTVSSLAFSAIASRFAQLLKCGTDMVASYRIVPYLQHLASYEQCSTCLLKMVVTWACSGFY